MRVIDMCMVLGLTLGGCAARPDAELVLVESPDSLNGREVDLYAFPRVFVTFKSVSSGRKIEMDVSRKNYEGHRIGVRHKQTFGVRRNININKVENSDLVKEVGVAVFDDRLAVIGSIGESAKMLINLPSILDDLQVGFMSLTVARTALDLPYTMDTLKLMPPLPPLGSSRLPREMASWQIANGIYYWFGPVSPDARLVAADQIRQVKNGIVYSACRELVLFFPSVNETLHLVVPDPRYFRIVRFPQKGKIVFSPDCGVSVTSERDDSIASNAAIGQEILKQIHELKSETNKK